MCGLALVVWWEMLQLSFLAALVVMCVLSTYCGFIPQAHLLCVWLVVECGLNLSFFVCVYALGAEWCHDVLL